MVYPFPAVSFLDNGTMFYSLLCSDLDVIHSSGAALRLKSDEQLAICPGFAAGYSSIDSGEKRGSWL